MSGSSICWSCQRRKPTKKEICPIVDDRHLLVQLWSPIARFVRLYKAGRALTAQHVFLGSTGFNQRTDLAILGIVKGLGSEKV